MTSQRAIVLLSCCLGICLFALGFLLGRESNRAVATTVPPPPAAATGADVDTMPAAAPSAPAAAPASPAPPTMEPEDETAPAVASSVRPLTAPAPVRAARAADDSGGGAAVARYFREVDGLQDVDVENPEASASALVSAATSGDTSGLRRLVSQARDAEQKARAVTPPPPCANYHEQLVSMLAESRSMVQRLEQGIGSGDIAALSALVSQANSAKSRSEALDRQARELKQRYGVTP